MAEENASKEPETEGAAASGKASGKAGGLKRFLKPKWIGILVVASIVVHGAVYTTLRLAKAGQAAGSESPEIALGEYHFEAGGSEVGPIGRAEFSLHIAILDQVDEPARDRIESYRFRVQQSVEELLRKAHSGDFDDPDLTGLKRQLQERINETLGIRVIADVIITDLKLQRRDKEMGMLTDRVESASLAAEPSS